MTPSLRISGARDGKLVELPADLDAIDIATSIGVIHISLQGQVPNMILVRSSEHSGGPGNTRLIMSPMDSGRLAIGVIKT